jgi:hypothetical protein
LAIHFSSFDHQLQLIPPEPVSKIHYNSGEDFPDSGLLAKSLSVGDT